MNLKTLLSGWSIFRFLWLVMGVLIAIQAISIKDPLAGFLSAFFLFRAVTNTGCCGVSSCSVDKSKAENTTIENVEFEEIK